MNWLTLSPEWLHDQEEHADSLGSAGSQLEASYHTVLSPFFLCSDSQLLELSRQKSNSTVLICIKNSNSDWEAEVVQRGEGAMPNRASQLPLQQSCIRHPGCSLLWELALFFGYWS